MECFFEYFFQWSEIEPTDSFLCFFVGYVVFLIIFGIVNIWFNYNLLLQNIWFGLTLSSSVSNKSRWIMPREKYLGIKLF